LGETQSLDGRALLEQSVDEEEEAAIITVEKWRGEQHEDVGD